MHSKGKDGKCHNRSTVMCIPAMCAHFTFPSLQKAQFPLCLLDKKLGIRYSMQKGFCSTRLCCYL